MATTGSMRKVKHAFMALMVVAMILVAAPQSHAITCNDVINNMITCLAYLKQGGNGMPPSTCCNGVNNLNRAAKATPDRQAACKCLKSIAQSLPDSAVAAAASLPKNCGVSIPYKITKNINCSTVV